MSEEELEIRRIEGIIPVEAISRDLPLKLENFSYYDMKKLLAQISKGAAKGDKGQEFENLLLKALFLEYTPDGKALLKVGNSVIAARLEVERSFEPGQELFLRVKSTSPRIELSLVEGKGLALLGKLLPELFKVNGALVYSVLNEKVRKEVLEFVRLNYPELYRELSAFFSKGELLPGKELLISLLLILRPEVYKRVKGELPKEVNRQVIKELIEFTVGSLLLFSTLGVLLLPLSGEGFEGRVIFGSYEGLQVALIDGKSPLGEFLGLVRAIGSSVSVELSGSRELLERIKEEELLNLLKEEGLKPVSVKKVDRERLEEVKRKLIKGSFVEFSA
ncbi:hypothetical protein [Thermovibrio sp.]